MKKTKLSFSRQTVRQLLSKEPLANVQGGAVNTRSCRFTGCCASLFDSCYNTQCCLEKP